MVSPIESRVLGTWLDLMLTARSALIRAAVGIFLLVLMIFAVNIWPIQSRDRLDTLPFQAFSSIVGGCIVGLSSRLIEPALLAAAARDGLQLSDLKYTMGWSGGLLGCIRFLRNPLPRKDRFWRWGLASAFFMLLSGSLTALIFTEGPNQRLVNCQVSNRTAKIVRDVNGATLSRLADGALGVLVSSWRVGDENNLIKTRSLQTGFAEVNNQAVRASVLNCTEIKNGTISTAQVNDYYITTLQSSIGRIMWPDVAGVFFTSNPNRKIGVHINSERWNQNVPASWICDYGAETEKGVEVDCNNHQICL